MVAGGRIPGYRAYAGRMSAEEYIAVLDATIRKMAETMHGEGEV